MSFLKNIIPVFLLLLSSVLFAQSTNTIVGKSTLSDKFFSTEMTTKTKIGKLSTASTKVRTKRTIRPYNQRKFTVHLGSVTGIVQAMDYYRFVLNVSDFDERYRLMEIAPETTTGLTVAFEHRLANGKFAYYIPINIFNEDDKEGSFVTTGFKFKYYVYNKRSIFQIYLAPSAEIGYSTIEAAGINRSDTYYQDDLTPGGRMINNFSAFTGISVNPLAALNITLEYGYGVNVFYKQFDAENSDINKNKLAGAQLIALTIGCNF